MALIMQIILRQAVAAVALAVVEKYPVVINHVNLNFVDMSHIDTILIKEWH